MYEGPVKTTTAFGAFIEIMPGTEGLLHISEMRHGRTEKTEDVVKKGDRVKVKLIERDERGRLRLSMKALQPKPEGTPDEAPAVEGNGAEPRAEREDRGERRGGRHGDRSPQVVSGPARRAESGFRSTVLSNGLTVLSEHMPGVRSVSFGAWIRSASVHERVEEMGAVAPARAHGVQGHVAAVGRRDRAVARSAGRIARRLHVA